MLLGRPIFFYCSTCQFSVSARCTPASSLSPCGFPHVQIFLVYYPKSDLLPFLDLILSRRPLFTVDRAASIQACHTCLYVTCCGRLRKMNSRECRTLAISEILEVRDNLTHLIELYSAHVYLCANSSRQCSATSASRLCVIHCLYALSPCVRTSKGSRGSELGGQAPHCTDACARLVVGVCP